MAPMLTGVEIMELKAEWSAWDTFTSRVVCVEILSG